MHEQGTISVHTENIFPIIKKFLYSDQEVFLRELVTNAVDAIQKRKHLAAIGHDSELPEQLRVQITRNEKLKTLTISDNGVGMTAEEIKQYINQVAFSGATAFIEKYKDQGSQQQLIGFFGLGFYAAFMVAQQVDIITRSYQKGAEAVHWTCTGTTQFELTKTVKKDIGTDIVLHLAEDATEFLQKERIQHILTKHCQFLPIPIELEGQVVNTPNPIWTQNPQELKEEDYLHFYQVLYPLAEKPLFWIHLQVDYPFHLTGILYFPIENPYLAHKEKIQLYAKQVFITDDVNAIVPDFLTLLRGVIDSPDIPLNVSRSALQSDRNVKKISTYITKKVADKLTLLFQEDRKAFEEKWDSMALFIKYGLLTDDKFYEKAQSFALLKTTTQAYYTIAEYKEKVQAKQTDKDQQTILLYSSAPEKQTIYVSACQKRGYEVVVFDTAIDSNWIELIEQKFDNVRCKAVDADTIDQLIDQGIKPTSDLTQAEKNQLQALYEQVTETEHITWTVADWAADEQPVTLIVPEAAQRMQARAQHLASSALNIPKPPVQAVINANHLLAKKLLAAPAAVQQRLAKQAYYLALLAQHQLRDSALADFIQASTQTLVDS